MDCGTCSVGGKVIKFSPDVYDQILTLTAALKPGHTGTGPIQIQTWDRAANSNFNGRKWYKNLPAIGGTFTITPSTQQQGISLFQKNPAKPSSGIQWDCCCVSMDNLNGIITIESF
jgi:hypothetical protein